MDRISIETLREYLERNNFEENHIEYILSMVDTLRNQEKYNTIEEIKKAIMNDVPLMLIGSNTIILQ